MTSATLKADRTLDTLRLGRNCLGYLCLRFCLACSVATLVSLGERWCGRIAVAGGGFSYLPVYLAQKLGCYREQGLDARLEDVRGGPKSLQALLGGSADVALIALELGMQVAAEGHHVRSFLTIVDRPGYVLAVLPAAKRKFRTIDDLKGAVIGVSSPGSGPHNFANYLLARHGVPLEQVSIVGVGLGAPAVAALEKGRSMLPSLPATELLRSRGASQN